MFLHTGLSTNDETVKTTLTILKYDDSKVRSSLLPWIKSFNILFYTLKKESIKFTVSGDHKY